jgi:hypothetical protein
MIRNEPLFTRVYDGLHSFAPVRNSAYLYGDSGEDRSRHIAHWSGQDIAFLEVTDQQRQDIVEIHDRQSGSNRAVSLRSTGQCRSIWIDSGKPTIYIDITGLAHHVWAPLLSAAIATGRTVRVIYVEPREYTRSKNPTEGVLYDLSEKIGGIRPLPGFASLVEPGETFCFVPLLGFEGTRFRFLLEHVQPPGDRIFPIIGVPGFQLEFPLVTYYGNKGPLWDSDSWPEVLFAAANDPFSLYYQLRTVARRNPGVYLKIAPIGTKPHALGAVLYALRNAHAVELVYDHPVRGSSRTSGLARLLEYDISKAAAALS